MSLTRYEQETIINFNEGEDTASVYTHNRSLIHRLERLAAERPEECRLVNTYPIRRAVEYYIPKWWLRIYPPRQISDEQRAVMAERMKAAKLRQKTQTAQGDSEGEATETGNYISQPSDPEKEA